MTLREGRDWLCSFKFRGYKENSGHVDYPNIADACIVRSNRTNNLKTLQHGIISQS